MDEGPADCTGLHNRPRDGTVAYDGVEMIEGNNVGTGDGIDDNAGHGRDKGPGIGTGNGLELAEGSGAGIGIGIGRGASRLGWAARRAE